MDGIYLKFDYEGIHTICFQCGKFGHAKENCKEKIHDVQAAQNSQNGQEVSSYSQEVENSSSGGDYGPWVMAERRNRSR